MHSFIVDSAQQGEGKRVRGQGEGTGCGDRVRGQGEGTGCGDRVWGQGEGTGCGDRVWGQGVGTGCGDSLPSPPPPPPSRSRSESLGSNPGYLTSQFYKISAKIRGIRITSFSASLLTFQLYHIESFKENKHQSCSERVTRFQLRKHL